MIVVLVLANHHLHSHRQTFEGDDGIDFLR